MSENVKILHKCGNCLIFDNGEVLYSFTGTAGISAGDKVDIIYYDSSMPIVCFVNGIKLMCCEPRKDVRNFVFKDDLDGFRVLNDTTCMSAKPGQLSVITGLKFQNGMYTQHPIIKGTPVVELKSAIITTYDLNSVDLSNQTIESVTNKRGKLTITTNLGLILNVESVAKAKFIVTD